MGVDKISLFEFYVMICKLVIWVCSLILLKNIMKYDLWLFFWFLLYKVVMIVIKVDYELYCRVGNIVMEMGW